VIDGVNDIKYRTVKYASIEKVMRVSGEYARSRNGKLAVQSRCGVDSKWQRRCKLTKFDNSTLTAQDALDSYLYVLPALVAEGAVEERCYFPSGAQMPKCGMSPQWSL
jgi:hypothetical protein